MAKEQKTELADQLVLVQDPILGSRYELQSVEVYAELDAPESETNEG
jgi:hypothetical protein